MKAPLILSSAIEKVVVIAAFLPLVFVVYPHAALAASTAQNQGENALVFEVNSKQKTNLQAAAILAQAKAAQENNPTLANPCYPGPIGSCNPDTAPAQQHTMQGQVTALEKVPFNFEGKTYSVEEVKQLIINYSAEYGISAETPLCIARLESGYNQYSKNRRSSASGVFQYLTSTWKHTDEGKAGFHVFDANANVKAAVKYMAVHKSTKPWTVRANCPPITFTK
jgi:hypothetical protein